MKLLLNVIFFLFPTFLFAGPFGFEIGKQISDYPQVSFEKMSDKTWWKASNVPTPNKLMETYVVRFSKKSGLCWIKGITVDITTTKYGTALKSKFDSVHDSLHGIYGSQFNKSETSFLASGSIWSDAGDYMMALVKKERFLYTKWEAKDSSNPIKTVFLLASALNQEKGYLGLEYYGKNSGDCDKEDSANDADGF